MINAGIFAGNLLVLDRSLTPTDGDIIIAALDDEFTVKTYRTGVKTGADGRKRRFVANARYGSGKIFSAAEGIANPG